MKRLTIESSSVTGIDKQKETEKRIHTLGKNQKTSKSANFVFVYETCDEDMTNKVNINTAALHDMSIEKENLHDFADFHRKHFFCKGNAAVICNPQKDGSSYREVFNNIDEKHFQNKIDREDIFVIKGENHNERNSQIEHKYKTENDNSAFSKFSLKGGNCDDSCTNHTTKYRVTTKICSSKENQWNDTKLFGDPSKICENKQPNTSSTNEVCTSLSDGNKSGIVDHNSNSISEEIWILREKEKIEKENKNQSLKRELDSEDNTGSKNQETKSIESLGSKVTFKEQKDNTHATDIFQKPDFTGDGSLNSKNNSNESTIDDPEKISEKWKISHFEVNLEHDFPTEKMFFTNFTGALFNVKETNVRCMEDLRDAILHNYSTSHDERNSILTVQTFEHLLSRLVDNRLMYAIEDGGYRVIGSRRPKPRTNKYLCFGYQQLGFEEENAREKIQNGSKNKNNDVAKKRNKVKSAKPGQKRKKNRNVLFGLICMKVVVKLSKTFPLM